MLYMYKGENTGSIVVETTYSGVVSSFMVIIGRHNEHTTVSGLVEHIDGSASRLLFQKAPLAHLEHGLYVVFPSVVNSSGEVHKQFDHLEIIDFPETSTASQGLSEE